MNSTSTPRGQFISFEGPDGAGKTTQLRLLTTRLEAAGRQVLCTREPGGTPLGEQLRALILPREDTTNDPVAELLLLNAARAQLVSQVIRPALANGTVVLADRYADATLAYQGYGRGGDLAELRTIIAIATRGLQPDRTILLDLPIDASLHRLTARGADNFFDRMGPEFRQRVRDGFLELAQAEPQRWVVIDGSLPVDEVAQRIWGGVESIL
ncbi:MAG TPA: dTMP kinase [Chloroflexota bacterium]|nr:dTMP kinase [Chloroflexota bacterium]